MSSKFHTRTHYNFLPTVLHFKSASTSREELRNSAYTKSLLECLLCLKSLAITSNKTQAKSQCGFSLLLAGEKRKQTKITPVQIFTAITYSYMYTCILYVIYVTCVKRLYSTTVHPLPSKHATKTNIQKVVL